MTFDAPTTKEIVEATGQDFEQVARDFYATAKAAEVPAESGTEVSSADD